MEHARTIRELALNLRNRALTVTDPFLCRELNELANICEVKASRIAGLAAREAPGSSPFSG